MAALLVAVILCSSEAPVDALLPLNGPFSEIFGDWQVDAFEYNGDNISSLLLFSSTWTFGAGNFSITTPVSTATTPFREFDFWLLSVDGPTEIRATYTGDDSAVAQLYAHGLKGIVRIDGDCLELCYTVSDEKPPKRFVSTPTSKLCWVRLSRRNSLGPQK